MELNCFRFAAAKVARSVSKPWAPLASSVGSGSASSVPCRKFMDAGTPPSRRPDNRSGQNTILFAWFLPFFLWIDHWGAKCASQCVSKSTLHLTWPCPNTTLPELQRNISVKDNLNFVSWQKKQKKQREWDRIVDHTWIQIARDGKLYAGSGRPSHLPDKAKKAALQRKMDKKLGEMNEERSKKTKKKWLSPWVIHV